MTIPQNANPILQGSSQERKKRFDLHCFSAGSNAIQSGIILISHTSKSIMIVYAFFEIIPWSATANPVQINILTAIHPTHPGTLRFSGYCHMRNPIRIPRKMSPIP
jgi:hypothetical protein